MILKQITTIVFRSKIKHILIFIGLFGMFIPLALTTLKSKSRMNDYDAEVRKLQAQSDSVQKKNQELVDALAFLESKNFQETFAKQQLNMQKQDETVYTIQNQVVPVSAPKNPEQTQTPSQRIQWTDNLVSWLYYTLIPHNN